MLADVHQFADALNVAATTSLEDPAPKPLYASATMADVHPFADISKTVTASKAATSAATYNCHILADMQQLQLDQFNQFNKKGPYHLMHRDMANQCNFFKCYHLIEFINCVHKS